MCAAPEGSRWVRWGGAEGRGGVAGSGLGELFFDCEGGMDCEGSALKDVKLVLSECDSSLSDTASVVMLVGTSTAA